jgi:hypothetical protein
VSGPLPAPATKHVLAPDRCVRCSGTADGTLRVAVWEEEEKGRLGARTPVLCAACHEGFFTGTFGRVEVAHWLHAAKEYVPREWIRRIDRDRLLETACLECGVILEIAGEPDSARCPRCATVNRLRRRGGAWITASRASGPPSS